MTARDLFLVGRARRNGCHMPIRAITEARRAGVQISLALAMLDQESSGGRNVWGHDPPPNGGTSSLGGQRVTKRNYLAYKQRRGSHGQGGMQGVGPMQLTWWSIQDEADREGGCWNARINMRIAFRRLAGLIDQFGLHGGVRRFNGSGPAAERYVAQVLDRQHKWHQILTGKR